MTNRERYIRVAVPVPLDRLFEYRLPAGMPDPDPGCRVAVPFGKRQLVGWVEGCCDKPEFDSDSVLDVTSVIDEQPLFSAVAWSLLKWTWQYYQHPPGGVVHAALPPPLRSGKPVPAILPAAYGLAEGGDAPNPEHVARKAPRQAEILQLV